MSNISKTGIIRALVVGSIMLATNLQPVLAAEQPLTLQEIVNTAIKSNPAVVETEKRWEEKFNRIPAATAQPNLKVGFMKDDIPTSSLNPGDGMMTEFTISQEFMNPSKLKLMGKMAENEANMSKTSWDEKQVAVYVQAKQAYYDYLYSKQALAIGKESQQLMGQLAKLAQVNYSTGMVPLQDTLKAQTEFSQMTIDLLNMASMEAVAKAKINNLMGRSTNTAFEVKEEFTAPPPDFDLAGLIKTATESKSSVVGMQYQADMAQNGIDLAKKQKLPDFEVSLGYKKNKEPMIDVMTMSGMDPKIMVEDRKPAWSIEVMAMFPIWQGKNKAEIKAAEAGYEASQAALQNMKNMAELDVQMALTEAQTSWRQIELYESTIVPQAEQHYQAAVVGYTHGKADFMTVLDGVNTLRNAKLGLYKAKVDYEKAAANLENAVGKPLFTSGTQP
ncbi:TolC family protein [Sporomusa sphaeroides]|uniref:Outer membrane protein TolC n=1 Tax=Sporomusa sphaeroides DSM 2875 TaxID=1337886 RepID=A0ABP2C2K8_9FIRM|nr:TolC family protein [Sporomusa sphaeroides]OLS56994.1 outer membrane protein TolC precursor [Sporomusa sphaeroides DSM 2875]CVK18180.1 Outer membrane protein TolC precursor [Sporomusa sphaeroides DSM 2875]